MGVVCGELMTGKQGRHTVMLTVDIVVTAVVNTELLVLMVRRANPPFEGCLALPGGFVEAGEDLVDAARRELSEETGLNSGAIDVWQIGTFGQPDRDSRGRVVSVSWLAATTGEQRPCPGSDATHATFRPMLALIDERDPQLAFDHIEIVKSAVSSLRTRVAITGAAVDYCKAPLQLDQLRNVYEAILDTRIDESEFNSWALSVPGWLKPVSIGTSKETASVAQYWGSRDVRLRTASHWERPPLRPHLG